MTTYESEVEIELPPVGVSRHERSEWNPRVDFRQEVEDTIRASAYIHSESLPPGNVITYTIHWEVGTEDSDIEDLYDLAIEVKHLESELSSMRYSGYPVISKPKEVT